MHVGAGRKSSCQMPAPCMLHCREVQPLQRGAMQLSLDPHPKAVGTVASGSCHLSMCGATKHSCCHHQKSLQNALQHCINISSSCQWSRFR